MELHTKSKGRRDFRVQLEGAPTGYCFHASCAAAVEAFNADLRREIWRAENPLGEGGSRRESLAAGCAPKPRGLAVKRPPFDLAKLRRFAEAHDPVDESFLAARSVVPVPPESVQRAHGPAVAAEFLEWLVPSGELVLIFDNFYGQGDFAWWGNDDTRSHRRGSFRLGDRAGVMAVRSELPRGGREGIWWLPQPVSGEWMPNPQGRRTAAGDAPLSRRFGGCVRSWRWMVLESDEAPADLWLRALVQLALPVAAVYTSGGRSIHALVRLDAPSKPEWDRYRDLIAKALCPLGADPGALSALRLTRLPGMLREGSKDKEGKYHRYDEPRLQRLLFLNPRPAWRSIAEMKP